MIGDKPDCLKCKHFNYLNKNGFTCKAFPEGIPKIINTATIKHRKPYLGDNGIRFEPIEDTNA